MFQTINNWLINLYIKYKLFIKPTKLAEPITTKLGTLKGKIEWDINGREFYCFLGIPYAEPPIGSNRFKAPIPAKKWDGILDATKDGSASASRDFIQKTLIGSEDCLYLNVFTPKLPDGDGNPGLPVMVWIHGGDFVTSSNTSLMQSGNHLMIHDVVLVTINYRLGLLGILPQIWVQFPQILAIPGFLSLEDPALGVPGNNGLKDMVLALKWVQNNIEDFGGDPGNVTIFGQSAGGCAVHLMMFSPMAKGLFHKVIPQSGCALNPWSVKKPGGSTVIKAINRDDIKTEKELLEYLQGLPAGKIVEIQEKIQTAHETIRPVGPVIENFISDDVNFLTENPINLIQEGRCLNVPIMIGYTSCEGMIADIFYKNIFQTDYVTNMGMHIPHYLAQTQKDEIIEKIRQFYFGGGLPRQDQKNKLYDLFADTLFIYGIFLAIRYHSKSAPIYSYRFSVETDLNVLKRLFKIKLPGVAHGDDIAYMFASIVSPKLRPNTLADKTVRDYTKLLTNFAKLGNPTPDNDFNFKWAAIESVDPVETLEIGDEIVLQPNPDGERIGFWREIHENCDSVYV